MRSKFRAWFFLVVLGLAVSLLLHGQAYFKFADSDKRQYFEAKVLMPTSAAAITTSAASGTNLIATYMVVSNPTGSSDTFTIQDSAGATYAMYKASAIAANSTVNIPLPSTGFTFAGGIYAASGSGNCVLRVVGGF
jgi:hypothetical protein